ncbi:hypothetical protein B0I31_1284 [Saccharothrix carnea]|uniref:Haloacid dehalogenase-like hydrolase n=1 Tax=Saccharothrix carnea TaxID=1280637 RepID=A0A2P8HEC6_SACCR|nr:hypothetical protein [Saccharothrix carnea]PSL44580.1 hypothetical protein B0I31_1284 [Saccharothrix carnea]
MIALAALDIAGTTVDEGGAVYRVLSAVVADHGVTDPAHVLVAGDTALDVRAGLAAHAGIVAGVLTGAQTRAELSAEHPTHVLGGVHEIPALLADQELSRGTG